MDVLIWTCLRKTLWRVCVPRGNTRLSEWNATQSFTSKVRWWREERREKVERGEKRKRETDLSLVIGKRPVFVNGQPVLPGKKRRLPDNAVLEVWLLMEGRRVTFSLCMFGYRSLDWSSTSSRTKRFRQRSDGKCNRQQEKNKLYLCQKWDQSKFILIIMMTVTTKCSRPEG